LYPTVSATTDTQAGGVGWGGCEEIRGFVENSGSRPDRLRTTDRQVALRDDLAGVPAPRRADLRVIRPRRAGARGDGAGASNRRAADLEN